MTDREAYKIGFLARCADEGLSPEDTDRRVKAAFNALNPLEWLTGPAEQATGAAKNLFGIARGAALPAAALVGGGALLAGGAAGAMAGKARSDPLGADETKAQDLIDQYNILTMKAQHERARRLRAEKGVGP